MVSIAHDEGFRSWEAIYHHGKNAPLRSACPDPAVLKPGSPVYIPEKGTKEHDCQTTRRHVFRVKTLKARMHFTVGNEDGPFVASRYELTLDGVTRSGVTTDKGAVDVRVPPDVQHATVKVWPEGTPDDQPWEWTLEVGRLDPLDTDDGLRARLTNLGYPPAPGDDGLREAIEGFQFDEKIDVTGVLDGATLGRLRTHHGA